MTHRFKTIILAAAVTSLAAIAVAPSAQARPTCTTADTQTICQTNGSVNIKVRPGTTAPPASQPALPWLLGIPGR